MSVRRIFPLALSLAALIFISACGARVIVLKDPLTPEEHVNLAVAYEGEGKWDEALRHYEAAAKGLPVANLYMGNVHFQKGEYERAEKSYRKALRMDPDNADAMNNLAWLYYTERRDLAEAEELARRALSLNPEKAHIYEDTLQKIRALKGSGPPPE